MLGTAVIENVFGWIGTVLCIITYLPQVIYSYSTLDVSGLSWLTLIVQILCCISWFVYGIMLNSLPIYVANAVAGICMSAFFVLKWYVSCCRRKNLDILASYEPV